MAGGKRPQCNLQTGKKVLESMCFLQQKGIARQISADSGRASFNPWPHNHVDDGTWLIERTLLTVYAYGLPSKLTS